MLPGDYLGGQMASVRRAESCARIKPLLNVSINKENSIEVLAVLCPTYIQDYLFTDVYACGYLSHQY